MINPFQHPEVEQLLGELLETLLEESGRGAILIGAAHIDDCLRKLFEAVFVADLSRKKGKELLNYPGPLSTFSAKIDVVYAMRLIPKHVYDALHALRRLRNDVAHTSGSFQLIDEETRYQAIFALGPNLPLGIRLIATKMMWSYKTRVFLDGIAESSDVDPDWEIPIKNEKDLLAYVEDHPELKDKIAQQLPHWELMLGITLLGGMIILQREKVQKLFGPDRLVTSFKIDDI